MDNRNISGKHNGWYSANYIALLIDGYWSANATNIIYIVYENLSKYNAGQGFGLSKPHGIDIQIYTLFHNWT